MPGILDTFYILFKGDTDDLKKGSKDAKKITDDLQSSIEKTGKSTVQLGSSFSDVIAKLSNAAIGFLSISSILSNAQQSIFYADAIGRFSSVVGLSTETVSAWGNAVKGAGGTAQAFQGAVAGLNNQLLDLALTGSSASVKMLNQLGIGVIDASGKLKTGFQLLRDIGTRLQSLPEQQAFAVGQRLGLDPALVAVLRSGSKEIETIIARQQKLGVVTKEQALLVRNLRRGWSDLTVAWRQTGLQTVERFGGVLQTLLKVVSDLAINMRGNESLMTGFFIAISAAAALALKPVVALAAPFIAVAAAILAFAFAYDDMQTYLAGGDSIIGRAIEKWPLLGDAINYVADALRSFTEAVPDWSDKAKKIIAWQLRFLSGSAVSEGLQHLLKGFPPQTSDANALLTEAENNVLSAIPSGAMMRKNPIANSRTINVKIDNVEVNTQATDAETIAADIADELRRQTENAIDNYDDGLLA